VCEQYGGEKNYHTIGGEGIGDVVIAAEESATTAEKGKHQNTVTKKTPVQQQTSRERIPHMGGGTKKVH